MKLSYLNHMKIYFLFFAIICFCACSQESIPFSAISMEEILEIKVKLVKAKTKQRYYTVQLKMEGNTAHYNMNDNRDKVVGSYVKDLGLIDKKGSVDLSAEDLDKLYKILANIDENRKKTGIIRSEFTIKSKKGLTKFTSYFDDFVKEFDEHLNLKIMK